MPVAFRTNIPHSRGDIIKLSTAGSYVVEWEGQVRGRHTDVTFNASGIEIKGGIVSGPCYKRGGPGQIAWSRSDCNSRDFFYNQPGEATWVKPQPAYKNPLIEIHPRGKLAHFRITGDWWNFLKA